jgi:hypothetical protein
MKIYWSADSMPALANLPPKQRQKILQTCTRKYAFRHWQFWLSIIIMATLAVLAARYIGPLGMAIVTGIAYSVFTTVINTAIYPDVKRYIEREFKP